MVQRGCGTAKLAEVNSSRPFSFSRAGSRSFQGGHSIKFEEHRIQQEGDPHTARFSYPYTGILKDGIEGHRCALWTQITSAVSDHTDLFAKRTETWVLDVGVPCLKCGFTCPPCIQVHTTWVLEPEGQARSGKTKLKFVTA